MSPPSLNNNRFKFQIKNFLTPTFSFNIQSLKTINKLINNKGKLKSKQNYKKMFLLFEVNKSSFKKYKRISFTLVLFQQGQLIH